MNQSFPYRKKHFLSLSFKKEIFQVFVVYFCTPPSLVLGLLWYKFFSQALIEVIIVPIKLIKFSIFLKNSRNLAKN